MNDLRTKFLTSGRIVSYSRDAVGRIAAVTTQANAGAPAVPVVVGGTYLPFGPLTALAQANGLALSVSFGASGGVRSLSPFAEIMGMRYATRVLADIMSPEPMEPLSHRCWKRQRWRSRVVRAGEGTQS